MKAPAAVVDRPNFNTCKNVFQPAKVTAATGAIVDDVSLDQGSRICSAFSVRKDSSAKPVLCSCARAVRLCKIYTQRQNLQPDITPVAQGTSFAACVFINKSFGQIVTALE